MHSYLTPVAYVYCLLVDTVIVLQGQPLQGQLLQGQVLQGQLLQGQLLQGQVLQVQPLQGQLIFNIHMDRDSNEYLFRTFQ